MAKRKKQDDSRVEQELKLLAGDGDASKTARALLRGQTETWGGYQHVPPGSLLDIIIREFEKKSHAPLEIPLFATMQILATTMLQKHVVIKIKGIDSPVIPLLWIFLLADSGSMKSMTFREILRWSGLEKEKLLWNLNAVAGPAAFVQDLAGAEATEDSPAVDSMNRRLAIVEEAGEFRKKMVMAQGPLAELISYFLMLYDHEDISRNTSKSRMSIKDPAINLLGFSVPEPFIEGISAEEMVSGFMQRHAIIFAETSNRKRHPLIKLNLKRTAKDWNRILESIQHTEYHVGSEAQRTFTRAYNRLIDEYGEIPDSFMLRILWTTHTYALLYHVLLGHGSSKNINAQAYGYAERMTRRMLADMSKAFNMTLHSETFKKLKKVEDLKERFGRTPTAREIYRNFRDIKIREAEYLLNIIGNQELRATSVIPGKTKIGGRPQHPMQ